MQADQRLAGGQRTCSGSGLPQGHHRQEGDDAGEDGGGFQGPHGDEAQRDPFVLPLDHRVQRDGGADAGEGHDHLQDDADEHAGVRAGADDVVRPTHRTVEKEDRDRDEGEQVEHARGQRDLSSRIHLDQLLHRLLIEPGDCDNAHTTALGLIVEENPRFSRGYLTMPRVAHGEPKGRICGDWSTLTARCGAGDNVVSLAGRRR